MTAILVAGLLGVFSLQDFESSNLQALSYVLSKILGYSLGVFAASMSVPFFKKNWWIFGVFVIFALMFFVGTTASILFPAPHERPF
ncbi:MAG: hypothetical protein WCK98_00990 [bacterium]